MGDIKARLRRLWRNCWAVLRHHLGLFALDGSRAVTKALAWIPAGVAGLLLALKILGVQDESIARTLSLNPDESTGWLAALRWAFWLYVVGFLMYRNTARYSSAVKAAKQARVERDSARATAEELRGNAADRLTATLATVDETELGYERLTSRDIFLGYWQWTRAPYFSALDLEKRHPLGRSAAIRAMEKMRRAGLLDLLDDPRYPIDGYEWRGITWTDRYYARWTDPANVAGKHLDGVEQTLLATSLEKLRAARFTFNGEPGVSGIDVAAALWMPLGFWVRQHIDTVRQRTGCAHLTPDEILAALPLLTEVQLVETTDHGEDTAVRRHYLYGTELYWRINNERQREWGLAEA